MWYAKKYGAYSRDSAEAKANAEEIYTVLAGQGWTVNAVSALLGNFGYEGGYNPWRWESDDVLNYGDPAIGTSYSHGYGLAQFTPAGKYIDDSRAQAFPGYGPNYNDQQGSLTDGNAQILFIDGYADYYSTSAYPLSYSEFKRSSETPEYLAAAWVYNYERPADPTATIAGRQQEARYWFDYLGGVTPGVNILFIKKKRTRNLGSKWIPIT